MLTSSLRFRHVITGAKAESSRDTTGGILADDMGLGKTLVILSTVAASLDRAVEFVNHTAQSDKARVSSKATLVIAPSSRELIRFH